MVPAERPCRSRRALLGGGYAVAAGLGATVLAACTTAHPSGSSSAGLPDSASKGSVSDRPVTLTYLNWFGPSDPQNVLFPHALKEFQQRHPQVHVEQIVASGSIM